MFRIKLKNFKNIFLKLPRKMAEKAFLVFLFLFLFGLAFGLIVFYRYSFLAEEKELKISDESLKFQENIYESVLTVWQERERRFLAADSKEYPDLFQSVQEQKKLSKERAEELLSLSLIQELLKITNLYQFFAAKGEKLFTIEERSQIWQELGLGRAEEYQGTYSQNIKLLEELKKELTK